MNGKLTRMLKALAKKLTKEKPELYKAMFAKLKQDYKTQRRGF